MAALRRQTKKSDEKIIEDNSNGEKVCIVKKQILDSAYCKVPC
jgi:hypothetical protein